MDHKVKRKQPKIKNKYHRIQVISVVILLVSLFAAIASIGKRFMLLNTSVEYERAIFISQIAEQMKNNMNANRKAHLELVHNMVTALGQNQPQSFDEVSSMFSGYAGSDAVNQLFFLSSECELYGIDGVKQWTSLPYEGYLLDALALEYTVDFIRIGMEREYMVFSAVLPVPIMLDGHEIGAVMYAWDSSEYRAVLSSKLFTEKSSSLLIGNDGNIAIYPEGEGSEEYGYNIFTYLNNQGMAEEDLESIRSMIADKEENTILCEAGGSRWLFCVAYYSDPYRIMIMLPIEITASGTYQNLYGLLASVVCALLILFLIVGFFQLSIFIRQRAQREKELQMEFLMKTAQVKNEFLAKMSHDIRTPLNGIIGMNYIASTKMPEECKEVREYLEKVDISAKYLLGILNDILDMSKIESGKLKLNAEAFALDKLIASIEPLVFSQLEGKNVRYHFDFAGGTDCDYIGDELRIKQVLMNLLSNAIKFTEEGSVTLTVTTKPVSEEKDEIKFSVRDTGKGMTDKFMESIFTPFTQEDTGIAARYGGSGLGLSIVKSYVDLMGGDIVVSSEINKGSEFEVTLTLERTAHSEPVEDVTSDVGNMYSFSGKRVLLCEDNDLNAEIAVIILERFGLKAERTENGRLGVEWFKRSAPGYYAMIFMDVRMPEMDGYEATREIRSLERSDAKKVPICALSANAFSDDIRESLASGMNEHLAKPLEIDLLAEVLKKYLG